MKTSKKIPKTFIVFLIISFFIWLLITFSKEYTTEISLPITFKNIPQNKLLQEPHLKTLRLSVKTSGFKLVTTQISNREVVIDASKLKKNKNGSYYLLSKNHFLKIQKQLFTDIHLQSIELDTIPLQIGELASKYVGVKSNLDLNYHIGYDLIQPIVLQPDSILISGPLSQIKQIDNLELLPLVLSDVKKDFTKTLFIKKITELKNIQYARDEVILSGSVDKFTEGKIMVPFIIKNKPEQVNLTILNDEVQLTFVVALSNFNNVSKASFKIECDYLLSKKNNLSYLVPKVVLKPNFVRNIKLLPSKIDFLIQK